jgi:hypothetical protein
MKSKDKKVCIVFDAPNWENTETARLLLKNEYPDTDLLDLSSHNNHPSGPRHENYKIFQLEIFVLARIMESMELLRFIC